MKHLLLLFCLFSTSLQAQDFLKSKDVLWAADFKITYQLDNYRNGITEDDSAQDYFELLQYTKPNLEDPYSGFTHLIHDFFDALIAEKKGGSFFYDEELSKEVPVEKLPSFMAITDTIITFHPDTYEEVIKLVTNDIPANNLNNIEVKQRLWYSKKDQRFYIKLLALRFFADQYDIPLNTLWIKPNKLNKNSSSNKQMLRSSCHMLLETKASKSKKKIKDLIVVASKNKEIDLYEKPWNYIKKMEQRDDQFIDDFYFKKITDTIITFDPETYEEQISIHNSPPRYEQMNDLGMHQIWYIDPQNRQIELRLEYLYPRWEVRDEMDNFLFYTSRILIQYLKH